MICSFSKNIYNIFYSLLNNNKHKDVINLIGIFGSIGGLSFITYSLYINYNRPYMHQIAYPYSGLDYTINYLKTFYQNSAYYFGFKKLTDEKLLKFAHLLNVDKYKDLYFNKLYNLKEKYFVDCNQENASCCHNKKNILFESTPRGNVIVFYNNDEEQFYYYCDNTLPYHILDSVLQKYAVTFHCVDIYNTNKFEKFNTLDKVQDEDNNKSTNNSKSTTTKSNVYAKLKKYNSNNNTNNNIIQNKIKKNKSQIDTTDEEKKEELTIFHKIKLAGNVRDFDFKTFNNTLTSEEKVVINKSKNDSVQKISYKQFKKSG